MVRTLLVFGMQQDVRIDEDHRCPSPWANATVTLAAWPVEHERSGALGRGEFGEGRARLRSKRLFLSGFGLPANFIAQRFELRQCVAIFRPARRDLRADHIVQRSNRYPDARHVIYHGPAEELVVSTDRGRMKCEIEGTEARDQIQQVDAGQKRRVARERHTAWGIGWKDLRVEVDERPREARQIAGVARGTNIRVARSNRGTVEGRGETADQDITNVMIGKRLEKRLRIEDHVVEFCCCAGPMRRARCATSSKASI